MPKFIPLLSTYPFTQLFPVPVNAGALAWRATENFQLALKEADELENQNTGGLINIHAADILERCNGLRGRLPHFPDAVVLHYRLPHTLQPILIPIAISQTEAGDMILGVQSDTAPDSYSAATQRQLDI